MLHVVEEVVKGVLEALEVVLVDVARSVDGPVDLAGMVDGDGKMASEARKPVSEQA